MPKKIDDILNPPPPPPPPENELRKVILKALRTAKAADEALALTIADLVPTEGLPAFGKGGGLALMALYYSYQQELNALVEEDQVVQAKSDSMDYYWLADEPN